MAVFWRKQMSVGNEWIDNDHRHLICLINTVEMTLRSPQYRDLLEDALDELRRYTQAHFKREEVIQYKTHYPGFAEHKVEHQALLARFEELRARFLAAGRAADAADAGIGTGHTPDAQRAATTAVPGGAGGGASEADTEAEIAALVADPPPAPAPAAPAEEDIEALVQLLRDWLIRHVLGTDAKMRPYLARYPSTLF